MSSKHHNGHEHMMHILDGDHAKSVKHRGAAKEGVGGLAHNQSNGYEHGNRREAFKHGGHVGHHKK